MQLSKNQIKYIANLARLELDDKEIEKYGSQLSDVLNYIDQLKELDTDGVEPTAQVTGLENVLKNDKINSWDEAEIESALKQAPNLEGDQYKVKRVLE